MSGEKKTPQRQLYGIDLELYRKLNDKDLLTEDDYKNIQKVFSLTKEKDTFDKFVKSHPITYYKDSSTFRGDKDDPLNPSDLAIGNYKKHCRQCAKTQAPLIDMLLNTLRRKPALEIPEYKTIDWLLKKAEAAEKKYVKESTAWRSNKESFAKLRHTLESIMINDTKRWTKDAKEESKRTFKKLTQAICEELQNKYMKDNTTILWGQTIESPNELDWDKYIYKISISKARYAFVLIALLKDIYEKEKELHKDSTSEFKSSIPEKMLGAIRKYGSTLTPTTPSSSFFSASTQTSTPPSTSKSSTSTSSSTPSSKNSR